MNEPDPFRTFEVLVKGKRRNAGEGYIRERKPGLWEAQYTGADGRRHSVYGKTKRLCGDKLKVAIADADKGIKPASSCSRATSWTRGSQRSRRPRDQGPTPATSTRRPGTSSPASARSPSRSSSLNIWKPCSGTSGGIIRTCHQRPSVTPTRSPGSRSARHCDSDACTATLPRSSTRRRRSGRTSRPCLPTRPGRFWRPWQRTATRPCIGWLSPQGCDRARSSA